MARDINCLAAVEFVTFQLVQLTNTPKTPKHTCKKHKIIVSHIQ